MSTPLAILLLIVGLVLLTVGAEVLVRHATRLALRSRLSPLFVGMTVVGFGTSMPELGASLAATLSGSAEIAVGNVVGSNIFNIGVILGIATLVRPISIVLRAIRVELGVAILAGVAPLVALLSGGDIGRDWGILFLAILGTHLLVSLRVARRASPNDQRTAERELAATLPGVERRPGLPLRDVLMVLLGLGLLAAGARALVVGAVSIARGAGVAELTIGLTIVAAGTSLPELTTTLVATLRRSADIAVGNILGSNIFNVFGILGVCAAVRPQHLGGIALARDVPAMILFSLTLLPIMRSGGRISRAEGAALLVAFAVYMAIVWTMSLGAGAAPPP